MKPGKIILTLALAMVVFCVNSQPMRVATYNLRYDSRSDSGNLWVDRAPIVAALIRFHDFDVFGTQEGLKNQLDDIGKTLPQYTRYGAGRDDGKEKGEHSAIFFKTDEFALLNKGDFWLSQTPDVPSLGWDATCCNRICSWVYLQHKASGKKFYFFNAHFDHQGVQARQESSKLILKKMQGIAGQQPVIFTGDLNGSHSSGWYQALEESPLLADTYNQVKYPYVNNASFNAFGAANKSFDIIDHIFVSKHFGVERWGILTDTYFGKFPSDHFPVIADVVLK